MAVGTTAWSLGIITIRWKPLLSRIRIFSAFSISVPLFEKRRGNRSAWIQSIPLCLKGFDKSFGDGYVQGTYDRLFDYGYWNSKEDMEAAMHELVRFTKKLFPQASASVYVPPSNIILSEEARSILAEEFPDIKAIASIYFKGDVEYTQDFEVAADGLVETPRIISGLYHRSLYGNGGPFPS